MSKNLSTITTLLFSAGLLGLSATAIANEDPTPLELVTANPQGTLVNPFDPTDPEIAKEGHQIFMETGCNGCHGGTGGGGMGPPLSNQRWVYGDEPDTLFRLVTLGTQTLQENGYSRIASEKVKAPMPPQASGGIVIIESSERLWKIITWIQSLHQEKDNG
ncbi:c-type cytochrome [Enterovibrio coralii]|nr:c-type cytochrome [Enterovibrio coralii]